MCLLGRLCGGELCHHARGTTLSTRASALPPCAKWRWGSPFDPATSADGGSDSDGGDGDSGDGLGGGGEGLGGGGEGLGGGGEGDEGGEGGGGGGGVKLR